MWRLKEHFNISVNAASSVSVKSDTVPKTNVFIQQMFTCAVLKFQWQRRYRWGFPNCIELRIVHIPILPFNSYQDLLSLYSIPFIIWYNNNDDMKVFRVKSKLFYLAADHFFLFETSRTADSKKENRSARMQLPEMGRGLNSFVFAVSVSYLLN